MQGKNAGQVMGAPTTVQRHAHGAAEATGFAVQLTGNIQLPVTATESSFSAQLAAIDVL